MLIRKISIVLIIIILLLLTTGCWDYREVEDLGVVTAVAIDKDKKNDKYLITAEIVNPTGGKEVKLNSFLFSSKGETVFDAIRNYISETGKKLYWGHDHYVIVSKAVAKEGITNTIDYFARDAEGRQTIKIMVSNEPIAGEMLDFKNNMFDSVGEYLDNAFRQSKNISKYPKIEMWENISDILNNDSTLLPMISRADNRDNNILKLGGTALFQGEHYKGFLNQKETNTLMFIRDQMEGGLIIVDNLENKKTSISLEIIKSKTKKTAQIRNEVPVIFLNIDIKAEISDITGKKAYTSLSDVDKISKKSKVDIKNDIERLVKNVQKEYGTDIFGFKEVISIYQPEYWEKNKKKWDEIFKELDIRVNVNMNIKGSAQLYKPVKEGGYK